MPCILGRSMLPVPEFGSHFGFVVLDVASTLGRVDPPGVLVGFDPALGSPELQSADQEPLAV